MIRLLRIDDRLVHGQVALTWTPAVGAECLVVANDKVAKDDFLRMTMNLAKPANVKLLTKSIADTVTFLSDERSRPMKILVLVNSVQDAAALSAALPEIRSINFGGIRMREGARPISKAIAVTDADVAVIRDLLAKGIGLEVRQVPTDEPRSIETLI